MLTSHYDEAAREG